MNGLCDDVTCEPAAAQNVTDWNNEEDCQKLEMKHNFIFLDAVIAALYNKFLKLLTQLLYFAWVWAKKIAKENGVEIILPQIAKSVKSKNSWDT